MIAPALLYIQIKPLHPELGKRFAWPTKAHAHDAGFDLCAAVDTEIDIRPGQTALVPCGFALAIPIGYEGQIRPRSGLSLRTGLRIPNAPGTIDAGYRGEIKVPLWNASNTETYRVLPGDRIAQLVIAVVPQVVLSVVETLSITARSSSGFGSTGG